MHIIPENVETRGFWLYVPSPSNFLNKQITGKKIVETVKKAGFNVLGLYPKEISGAVYYPSKVTSFIDKYGEKFLSDVIREAQKAGLTVYFGILCLQDRNVEEVRRTIKIRKVKKLFQKSPKPFTVGFEKNRRGRIVYRNHSAWACPNHEGYESYLLHLIDEIISRYGDSIACLQFEALRFYDHNYCVCDVCRELFKEKNLDLKQLVQKKLYKHESFDEWVDIRVNQIATLQKKLTSRARETSHKLGYSPRLANKFPIDPYSGYEFGARIAYGVDWNESRRLFDFSVAHMFPTEDYPFFKDEIESMKRILRYYHRDWLHDILFTDVNTRSKVDLIKEVSEDFDSESVFIAGVGTSSIQALKILSK